MLDNSDAQLPSSDTHVYLLFNRMFLTHFTRSTGLTQIVENILLTLLGVSQLLQTDSPDYQIWRGEGWW